MSPLTKTLNLLLPILTLLTLSLSADVTIHAISSPSGPGNCFFLDQQLICNNGNLRNSITIDGLRTVTIGIGINHLCYNANTIFCNFDMVWSEDAHDATIADVYFRDDQCFWDQAENGRILQNRQGHNICYKNLNEDNNCKSGVAKNPFYDYVVGDPNILCRLSLGDEVWRSASGLNEDTVPGEAGDFE